MGYNKFIYMDLYIKMILKVDLIVIKIINFDE